jgi:dipeptidyl aminopeptidase/acylaminoacyl peptidase
MIQRRRVLTGAAAAVGLALAATLSGSVAAQPSASPAVNAADAAFDQLSSVHRIAEVALSPDGARVAWIEESPRPGGTVASTIEIAALGGGSGRATVRLGDDKANPSVRHLSWSPEGTRLAFLSDAGTPGQIQIQVANAAGGAPRRLTDLKGELGTPRWSPEGRTIAFLFIENARAAAGPVAAKPTETGVIGDRMDVQRLATVDVASGRVRTASPESLYIHEYDWAPDGHRFVATAAPPPGDDGWYVSKLYAIDAGSGEATVLFAPSTQIGGPRFSPDGASVAFIAGLMSDEGPVGGDVFVVSAAGGEPRNLTPGRPTSASWLTWRASSGEILFAEYADGGSGVAMVDLGSGKVESLWRGPERLSALPGNPGPALAVARDGKTTAVVRQSFERAPEVWSGPVGAWRQVSRANAGAARLWGEVKNLTWKSDDLEVQGWLVAPREVVAGQRYPLLVHVHGGPASSWVPTWAGGRYGPLAFASDGYFVFLPNPRGSHGRGQAFTRGNVKDLGGGDLRDILTGVDEVVKTAPVDGQRLGITGGSYGGFMTMWAVTQTRRFRAAVAVAGISNWQSYWGQNGIPRWMLPYFGATVYDDPALYAKSSPINFIKNVATPTLVLVGEGDIECPPPQSYEFWRALRALGVKSELVVYAGEGHGNSKPENRRDELRRTWAWFRDHLAAAPVAAVP